MSCLGLPWEVDVINKPSKARRVNRNHSYLVALLVCRAMLSQGDSCFLLSLQAFFCGRSDYFKALLEDHFSESEELQTQPSIPVVTLHNISEEIFIRVLYYIYSDDTEVSFQFSPFLSTAHFWNVCSCKDCCGPRRKVPELPLCGGSRVLSLLNEAC